MAVSDIPSSPAQGLAVRPASGVGIAPSSRRRRFGDLSPGVAGFVLEQRRMRGQREAQRQRERDIAARARGKGSSVLGAFGSGAQAVLGSGLAQNLLSGEEFINTVGGLFGDDDFGTDIRNKLEDTPTIGGFLGVAFDVGASPLTLLTAGSGGAVAGRLASSAILASKAGRPVTAVTRAAFGPIVPVGNPLQRYMAETAIGTIGATVGQEITERAGPQAGLVAGLGSGLLGIRGIHAAQRGRLGAAAFGQPRTGAEAVAQRTSPATGRRVLSVKPTVSSSGNSQGRQFFPDQIMTLEHSAIPDEDNVLGNIGDIVTGNDSLVRDLEVQKTSYISKLTGLTDATYKKMGKRLYFDEWGNERLEGVIDTTLDANIHGSQDALVGEFLAFQPGQPGRFLNVDSAAKDFVEKMHLHKDYAHRERSWHGTDTDMTVLEPNETFFPRRIQVSSKRAPPVHKPTLDNHKTHNRTYRTFKDGVEKGRGQFTYKTARDSLLEHAEEIGDNIVKTEAARGLFAIGSSNAVNRVTLTPATIRGLPKALKESATGPLIGDKAWETKYFDRAQARRIEKYLEPTDDILKHPAIARGVGRINKTLKQVRAGIDVGGLLITNAVLSVGQPHLFAKVFIDTFKDVLDPKRIDEFFADPETARAGRYTEMSHPTRPGVQEEFVFGAVEGGKAKSALGKFIEPFTRHFVMAGNRMRRDAFLATEDLMKRSIRAGAANQNLHLSPNTKLLDENALHQVGRSLSRATGLATTRSGSIERNVLFASNFYRSMIETIGKLFMDGGLEGDLARQYMGTYVSNGLLAVTAAALVGGRDLEEVLTVFDQESLKRGELRMNPNFATINIPGTEREISIFGPWDSNARLAVMTGQTAFEFSDDPSDRAIPVDFLQQIIRMKGSPVASALTNVYVGDTFTGLDTFSPEGIATSVLPFAASGAVDDVVTGIDWNEAGIGAALNFLGLKERPKSPTDQLNVLAMADPRFRRLFRDLTAEEQDILLKKYPKIAELREIQKQQQESPEGQFLTWLNENRENLRQQEVDYYDAWLGDFSRNAFDLRTGLQAMRRRHFDIAEARRVELGIDFPTREGTPNAALGAYYDLYRDSKDMAGIADWDLYEANKAALFSRIDAGEFGEPARAHEFIDERREAVPPPELQWFEDNMDIIRETTVNGYNYWDQLDRAFEKYQGRASRIAGYPINSYKAIEQAVRQSAHEGNRSVAVRLTGVLKNINSAAQSHRKRMRRKNKELDEALRANGYGAEEMARPLAVRAQS